MADDVDSHIEFWQFPITATVDDLMVAISRQLLPGIAGPAGWCVYLDIHDLARRRVLGLIYTRDDLGQEDTFCRYATGSERLANLAHGRSSLEVDAVYLTGDAARPLPLREVTASDSVTGSRPKVLGRKPTTTPSPTSGRSTRFAARRRLSSQHGGPGYATS